MTVPVCDAEQEQGNRPPSMPDNALQYNRTDITPVYKFERITEREVHVFFYRNFTLVFNCSRNMELNLTIDAEMHPRILSLDIGLNRSMNLNMNLNVSPPQGVTVMERSLNFYADLEANDSLPLQATLRFYINETALNKELNRTVNCSRLMWHYWNMSIQGWVPFKSYIDNDGYLVCNTTHFSTWTVIETMPLQVTGELSKPEVIIGESVTISAVVRDGDGNPVDEATVTATIGDLEILLSLFDQGSGNYRTILDTSNLAEGTYLIVIKAEKNTYIQDQDTLALEVLPQPFDWTPYIITVILAAAIIIVVIYLAKRK